MLKKAILEQISGFLIFINQWLEILLIYEGMKMHQGEIVERVIRNNGFSITALAKGLNVNRRSLYNWFQSETLKSDVIYTIGVIIKHDFSIEFPKLFNPEHFQEIYEPSFIQEDRDNEAYKEKYLKLLETYNELLVDTIELSNADADSKSDQ